MPRRIEPQAEQWPQRVARPQNALDPEHEQYFHMRDPELSRQRVPGGAGTVPHFVGGDPPGAVNIVPRAQADPNDAFVMRVPGEDDEGYDALVKYAPGGKGFDVLKELRPRSE